MVPSSAASGWRWVLRRRAGTQQRCDSCEPARPSIELHVGVTDVGARRQNHHGADSRRRIRSTAFEGGRHSGDTAVCPYSVGESGSRTTMHTGYAVIQAVRDLKHQIAEKASRKVTRSAPAARLPIRRNPRNMRATASRAHFAEVEVDTELGHARVVKYLAAHDSGRIINPLTAAGQVRAGPPWASAWRCTKNCCTTHAWTAAERRLLWARVMTHLDTPEIEVIFVETEDQYGPFGAKTIGESSNIPSVAAVGKRHLQRHRAAHQRSAHTRDKLIGGAGMRAFSNANPNDLRKAVAMLGQAAGKSASIVGGGSDLLGMVKEHLVAPDVSSFEIHPGAGSGRAQRGGVKIGGLITLDTLSRHPAHSQRIHGVGGSRREGRDAADPQRRNARGQRLPAAVVLVFSQRLSVFEERRKYLLLGLGRESTACHFRWRPQLYRASFRHGSSAGSSRCAISYRGAIRRARRSRIRVFPTAARGRRT